jgi:hypothetical protein
MPTVDDQVAEWKHAYQVLGVPHYASAHVIKAAYRKLVKRWHPDLYAAGTSEHADATQMSMLINQAHSGIAHAPLRYTSNSPVFNRRHSEGTCHLDPRSTLGSTLSGRTASTGWNSGFDLFVERSLEYFRVSRGFSQR